MKPHLQSNKKDKDLRVRRRNIPVHIIFWLFVLLLLYLFWKAFSGHTAP
ncbi:MAG TPA: hypothetical protein VGM11_07745 [Acidobacteriaceae bacterium]|jgi:hypothetical protein